MNQCQLCWASDPAVIETWDLADGESITVCGICFDGIIAAHRPDLRNPLEPGFDALPLTQGVVTNTSRNNGPW